MPDAQLDRIETLSLTTRFFQTPIFTIFRSFAGVNRGFSRRRAEIQTPNASLEPPARSFHSQFPPKNFSFVLLCRSQKISDFRSRPLRAATCFQRQSIGHSRLIAFPLSEKGRTINFEGNLNFLRRSLGCKFRRKLNGEHHFEIRVQTLNFIHTRVLHCWCLWERRNLARNWNLSRPFLFLIIFFVPRAASFINSRDSPDVWNGLGVKRWPGMNVGWWLELIFVNIFDRHFYSSRHCSRINKVPNSTTNNNWNFSYW